MRTGTLVHGTLQARGAGRKPGTSLYTWKRLSLSRTTTSRQSGSVWPGLGGGGIECAHVREMRQRL